MDGSKIFTIQNQDAGFCFIWGIYAGIVTPDLFSRVPGLYHPLVELAPQMFWGYLFIICGIAAWILSYFNKRVWSSLLLGAIYVFFATMYYKGDSRSPGGSLYIWLGLFNLAFSILGGFKWTQTQ